MPQVPYQAYSTAQPTSPGEEIHVDAPPAAFGANIGEAVKGLGGSMEGAGNEIFQRAMALQQLQNENAARESAKDVAEKISLAQANFDSLEGQAKVNALQPHLQNLKNIIAQGRNGLTNDIARQQYDTMSFGFYERNLFSSARGAGDALKNYTLATYEAQQSIANKQASDHYDDAGIIQQHDVAVNAAVNRAMAKAGITNPNDPIAQKARMEASSSWWRSRIEGANVENAPLASRMFDAKKGELTEDDKRIVQTQVNNKNAAVFASNFVNDFVAQHRTPEGDLDMDFQDAEKQIRDQVKEQLPNNELAPEAAVSKFKTMLVHDSYMKQQDRANTNHTIATAVVQGMKQKDAYDWQDLSAQPGMDKIIAKWQKLNPGQDIGEFVYHIVKSQNQVTKEASMLQLGGARDSSDPNAQEWFLNQNPYDPKWHLNSSDAAKIHHDQVVKAKDPSGDPRVMNAFRTLKAYRGTDLGADGLNIINRSDNPSDYDHFLGTLSEALDIWKQDHNGKPPGTKELVDIIGPEVTKKTATYAFGFLGGGPAFRDYQRPTIDTIPETWKAQKTQEVLKLGGQVPTDDQLVDAYARFQYNKLIKNAKPSTSK